MNNKRNSKWRCRYLDFTIFWRFWSHDILLVAADDIRAKFH